MRQDSTQFAALHSGNFDNSGRPFAASAAAGQINPSPVPTASGPGLGFVNIADNMTSAPNNDDSPGAQPDNNMVVLLNRFDSTGFIDVPFTISPTAGVTEYQFTEFVDNNTGSNWSAYNLLLGFGTGAGFTQVGGIGDGLDFDTGPPGGNTPPPTSVALPAVSRPNEDTLAFSGGTQSSGAQQYQFRVDVSDIPGRGGTFTLRQQPIAASGDYNHNGVVDAADYVVWRKGLGTGFTQNDYNVWRSHFSQTASSGSGASAPASVPEPPTFVLVGLAVAGIGFRGRNSAWGMPQTR